MIFNTKISHNSSHLLFDSFMHLVIIPRRQSVTRDLVTSGSIRLYVCVSVTTLQGHKS